ncbi:MAG: hypothetical protein M1829_000944 [Trizodia sp. TS-e1964]|nr:MAG: hypothetical protein M1829_000944 [Trizodia sp. TS-e1964]
MADQSIVSKSRHLGTAASRTADDSDAEASKRRKSKRHSTSSSQDLSTTRSSRRQKAEAEQSLGAPPSGEKDRKRRPRHHRDSTSDPLASGHRSSRSTETLVASQNQGTTYDSIFGKYFPRLLGISESSRWNSSSHNRIQPSKVLESKAPLIYRQSMGNRPTRRESVTAASLTSPSMVSDLTSASNATKHSAGSSSSNSTITQESFSRARRTSQSSRTKDHKRKTSTLSHHESALKSEPLAEASKETRNVFAYIEDDDESQSEKHNASPKLPDVEPKSAIEDIQKPINFPQTRPVKQPETKHTSKTPSGSSDDSDDCTEEEDEEEEEEKEEDLLEQGAESENEEQISLPGSFHSDSGISVGSDSPQRASKSPTLKKEFDISTGIRRSSSQISNDPPLPSLPEHFLRRSRSSSRSTQSSRSFDDASLPPFPPNPPPYPPYPAYNPYPPTPADSPQPASASLRYIRHQQMPSAEYYAPPPQPWFQPTENSHPRSTPHPGMPVSFPHAAPHLRSPSSYIQTNGKETIAGYELLASRLSSFETDKAENDAPLVPVYRKFESLNHRVLLHLQDELSQLEEELRRYDEAIAQRKSRGVHELDSVHRTKSSRRQDAEFGGEIEWGRLQVLGNIFFKIGQYNQALSSYNNLIKSLDTAKYEDIEKYKSWMTEHAPIAEQESRFLTKNGDLMSLLCPDKRVDTFFQLALVLLGVAVLLPTLAFTVVSSFLGRMVVVTIVAGAEIVLIAPTKFGSFVYEKDWGTHALLYAGVMTVMACIVA